MSIDLRGIYAAVITPYNAEGSPSIEDFQQCLEHLAGRGCHGVLVSGTTGEAASLSIPERISLFKAATGQPHGLRILAGTGAASLEDTIELTRAAYDAGCNATVIIPPFFYKGASDDGFFAYFEAVISRAIPSDGAVVLYHNPVATAVGISLDLVRRLRDAFPSQIVGIKDSSQNWDWTQQLIAIDPDFRVFVGDDRLLGQALQAGGAGSVSLVANAFPDLDREVFDLQSVGQPVADAQVRLSQAHAQFDGLPRIPAVKALMHYAGVIDNEAVRPPLVPLTPAEDALLKERFLLDIEIPGTVRLSDLYDASTP